MLKIYNSLTKKTEEFKPLVAGQVSIYVCGPTVYSYLHVGNFRGPVFFNFVREWFEYLGYKTTYALNFTDVDDKIITRAAEEKVSASEIAERYIKEYKQDFASLGLRPHDLNPKVSEYMPQIISMIEKLIENKNAYAVEGDVQYDVTSFQGYGKLSGRNIDDMKVGVRIEANEKKHHPLDFALWKSAKPHEKLQGSVFSSPWGNGRPGWHIECSAMVKGIFGDQIDIHGGGLDLVFPHHENEIAQSEGCSHTQYVKTWMHWNLINFSGAKMSKSLGNVVTMREFLETQHAEVYKWMMLSSHYRSVAEFSEVTINLAISALARVYSALAIADLFLTETQQKQLSNDQFIKSNKIDAQVKDQNLVQAWGQIENHLNDDFSTPQAIAVMFEQIRKFNSQLRRGLKPNDTLAIKAYEFKFFMRKLGQLFSLFQMPAEKFLRELDQKILVQNKVEQSFVEEVVEQRRQARLAKDFAKADEYRAKLTEMKITVSDLADGTCYWEVIK